MRDQVKYQHSYERDFQIIHWKDFDLQIRGLYESLNSSGYLPDTIIGIFQGGWIVAQALADYFLEAKILGCTYKKKAGKGRSVVISTEDDESEDVAPYINSKNVLIVDEVVESGKTITEHRKYIERFNPEQLKAACLYQSTHSILEIDYIHKKFSVQKNFIFPWRFVRELDCIVYNVRKNNPDLKAENDIQSYIQKNYNIYVPTIKIKEAFAFLGKGS